MVRALQTVSVVEAATNRLRESLFVGEYAPGEEVKDTHIARAFGIARPTARIAVQNLVNEGMLDRKPGSSARVRVFGTEQVDDIYRVRKLIEIDAIREIRARDLPLHRVEETLVTFGNLDPRENWAEVARADVAFHTAVVDSASSPRLKTFFAALINELRLLIAIQHEVSSSAHRLYCEHDELLEHLRSSPLEVVETAWLRHLESARQFRDDRAGCATASSADRRERHTVTATPGRSSARSSHAPSIPVQRRAAHYTGRDE